MFYLTTHSTHFIYGYVASDIWLRTILIVRKKTRCRHIGYSYQLTARVLLYAPSHRQDNTYRYTRRYVARVDKLHPLIALSSQFSVTDPLISRMVDSLAADITFSQFIEISTIK